MVKLPLDRKAFLDRADAAHDELRARAEAAEANLARAREIMKPFAAVANLMAPLVKSNPERWPDDKPNSEFIPGNWPRWSDFRAVSRFLTEGEGT